MSFGSGGEEGAHIGEIACDGARKIDDGEECGEDDGFWSLFRTGRSREEEGGAHYDGKDFEHGRRIRGVPVRWQAGLQMFSNAI